MPLKDHFHPPLAQRRQWTSFHALWAGAICIALNKKLPPGFHAEPQCKFVQEIDVAALEEGADNPRSADGYEPPAPALTIAAAPATDTVEARVFFTGDGDMTLAGAIELISPSNKDRAAEREAFVSKCASYIHLGAGVLIVDVVTQRRANLHAALLKRLSPNTASTLDADLYAAAYQPERQSEETLVRVWQEALALGETLPTMPLWLAGGPCMAVELEATYDETCRNLRIVTNGSRA